MDYIKQERYDVLAEMTDNNKEEIQSIVEKYGVDSINNGYVITDYNCTGMLEIQKIDEIEVFEDDAAAVSQAMKDGIAIIPVEELPDDFPKKLRYLGWVDTKENREQIAKWTKINTLRDFLAKNKMSFQQFIRAFNFASNVTSENMSLYIDAYNNGVFDSIGHY